MTFADKLAPKIDWDLVDGKTKIHGRSIGGEMLQGNLRSLFELLESQYALLVVSRGDSFPVDIGFFYDGENVTMDVATLKVAIKEFETGRLFSLNVGDEFFEIQRDGQTRYRVELNFQAGAMGQILAKYADPGGTLTHVLAEAEGTFRFKMNQTGPSDSAPLQVQNLSAGQSSDFEIFLPLDVADGSSKTYTIRTSLKNAFGNPLHTAGGANEFFNVQEITRRSEVSVSRTGNAVTVSGSFPGVAENFDQVNPQYAPLPVWISSATSHVIEGADLGVTVSGSVVMEAFLHAGLDLEGDMYAAAVTLPRLTWLGYGRDFRGTDKFKVFPGGTGAVWSSKLEIFLIVSGSPVLVKTVTQAAQPDLTLSQLISHASGSFYILGYQGPSGQSGNENTFQFVFSGAPTATAVRIRRDGDPGSDVDFPITVQSYGTTVPVQLSAEVLGGELPDDPVKIARKTTQEFVIELRRDLIPDVAPDPGGS